MGYNDYMDRHHSMCKEMTAYWDEHSPQNPDEYFAYGLYQYEVLDYKEAFSWFLKAGENNVYGSFFMIGYFYENGLWVEKNALKAQQYYGKYLQYTENHFEAAYSTDDDYRMGMCYAYGFAVDTDIQKAIRLFEKCGENGEALYELGRIYENGFGAIRKDYEKAADYYLNSFKNLCGKGLWAHFKISGKTVDEYEYRLWLKTWYGYRLGCHMRVVKVNPGKDSFTRLAEWYRLGYPGDTEDGNKKSYEKYKTYREKSRKYQDLY